MLEYQKLRAPAVDKAQLKLPATDIGIVGRKRNAYLDDEVVKSGVVLRDTPAHWSEMFVSVTCARGDQWPDDQL